MHRFLACGLGWLVFMGGLLFAGNNIWTFSGLHGGSIRCLVMDPADPLILYVAPSIGSSYCRLFKSTDGGFSWFPSDYNGMHGELKLAIDPVQTSTLYAGGVGISKSTDGGAHWSASGLSQCTIKALVVDPLTPDILYAGVSEGQYPGVYKSSDAGRTWIAMNNGLSNQKVGSLAIHPSNPSVLYMSTTTSIFKSENGGESWFETTNGLTAGFYYPIAISPSNPQILYVGTKEGPYRSMDGGATWVAINSGLPTLPFGSAFCIDPANPFLVYASIAGKMFRSQDGGEHWEECDYGLSCRSVNCLAICPSYPEVLFAGTDGGVGGCGGVYITVDRGGYWWQVGLSDPTTVFELARADADPSSLLAATCDGVYKSSDHGRSWYQNGLTYGNVWTVAIDPHNPNNVYAGTWYDGAWKSTNGGEDWDPMSSGLEPLYTYRLITVDPSDSSILYLSGQATLYEYGGIYKSTDAGNNWSLLKGKLYIYGLCVDPFTHTTVYACGDEGIIKSTDGGHTWSPIMTGLPGSNYGVRCLIIDPTDSDIIYAGSVYDGTAPLYKSTNAGGTWEPCNSGIPERNGIYDIQLDPTFPAHLFVATPAGVYRSLDAGRNWRPLTPGFPYAAATAALAFDPSPPSTLYALTSAGAFSLTFTMDMNQDGISDSRDLLLLANYLAENLQALEGGASCGDINLDRRTNIVDCVVMMRELVNQ